MKHYESLQKLKVFYILLALFTVFGMSIATPQDELAKQAQNPIANLISLPLQNNANFNSAPMKERRIFSIFNRSGLLSLTITGTLSRARLCRSFRSRFCV